MGKIKYNCDFIITATDWIEDCKYWCECFKECIEELAGRWMNWAGSIEGDWWKGWSGVKVNEDCSGRWIKLSGSIEDE